MQSLYGSYQDFICLCLFMIYYPEALSQMYLFADIYRVCLVISIYLIQILRNFVCLWHTVQCPNRFKILHRAWPCPVQNLKTIPPWRNQFGANGNSSGYELIMSTERMSCMVTLIYRSQPILNKISHYNDVKMSKMASQITSLTIVYSTVYSGVDRWKNQRSASLAFARAIRGWPVNSPHKWPVTLEMFPFDAVIVIHRHCRLYIRCVNKTVMD